MPTTGRGGRMQSRLLNRPWALHGGQRALVGQFNALAPALRDWLFAGTGITIRGVGQLQASSTDTAVVTFPYPPGSVATDVDYLLVQGSSAGDTDLTDPGGWTRLGSLFLEIGANDMELYVWRRVLAGSDALPTITVDTAHSGAALGVYGFIVGWIGVDNTTPEDAAVVFSSSAPAATFTPSAITTVTADAVAVSVVVTDDDNLVTFNPGGSASFHEEASGAPYQTTVGGDTAFGLADKTIATPAAVTQPTWLETVLGNDAWIGAALALRPFVPPSGGAEGYPYIGGGYYP